MNCVFPWRASPWRPRKHLESHTLRKRCMKLWYPYSCILLLTAEKWNFWMTQSLLRSKTRWIRECRIWLSKAYGFAADQAEIISVEEEDKMWNMAVLGDTTPQKLVDTILYMFGVHFALRAGTEHRNLRHINSQISLHKDTNGAKYLCYTEDVSKNCQGGPKHRKITPKCVRAYENKLDPDKCTVRLYEKYVSHRPTDANCSSAFYLRPLVKPVSHVWYSCQALGIHTLSGTVAKLCKQANLPSFRSNHSLRATSVSRLYDNGFDEQLVCETTGHRSSAVRSYKRTSDGQKKNISSTLYAVPPTSHDAKEKEAPCSTSAKDGGIHVTLNISKLTNKILLTDHWIKGQAVIFAWQEDPIIIFRSKERYIIQNKEQNSSKIAKINYEENKGF